MKKFSTYFLLIVLISCSSDNELIETSEIIEDTSTTLTISTTTTSTSLPIELNVDQYGIELVEITPRMQEQIYELMEFVESKVGLNYTEDPKFNLYSVSDYQEYNAVSYLDDFEEDYEEGEWERAVLSENMWGLTNSSPEEMKELITEFQRCASAGSYNLLDKILRVPIKKRQNQFNLWEQSVLVHELVHSLQGQHFEVSSWYQEMKDLDDFSAYPGIRALMEAQADFVQNEWESKLDEYDRQTFNSQFPNISCRVQLPSYFYIPNDLYYSYGPSLVKKIINDQGMDGLNNALYRYKNEGLYNLPTSEQIYNSEKFFVNERYSEVIIDTIKFENFELIDEGTMGSLDLVYVLQGIIGKKEATNAAVGLGGGSWKDYSDSNGNLVMTVKLIGDTYEETTEIYNAYLNWANSQKRFNSVEDFSNGKLYIGNTNVWISFDGSFVRIILTKEQDLIKNLSNNLLNF